MTHCLLFLFLSCTPGGKAIDAVYLGSNAAQAVTAARSIDRWENSKPGGQVFAVCLPPGPCPIPQPSYARLPWQRNTATIAASAALEPLLVNQLPPRLRLAAKLARIGFNVWAIQHNLTHTRTVPAATITVRF